ncbi:cytochrome c553 [Rhodopseudomonas thermotolerans]|jgi:mono/diheme cytochrome c family protein|uniref:Cytochrome c553 n=2 Tax=Rhodopseudomonas TaxID=1073 RepID=A0A336JU01_9BRAD|nr:MULTISPECIES: c-type cytochrome [Rhodopseudomonas]RED34435.1 cytochrome c553 [Rhodopseudomonas pentothenatexigens]REG02631.1 cytochrome c553 [Rhodopseudomonas thermotolerans]SSW91104.1 cytochrome c553 [Rhodopseudomonas pentothenatexigens]
MRALTLGLSLLLIAVPGRAPAADAQNGETLAKRWCTGCHVVSDEQRKGSDMAPSFAAIASQPNFNEERLAFFLLEPHPKMANMALSRNDTKDLAAYIGQQKRR